MRPSLVSAFQFQVGVVFKDYPMGKSVRKDVVPASIPHEEEAVGTREVRRYQHNLVNCCDEVPRKV